MHPRLVLSAGNFFSAMYFSLVLVIATPYLALFLPEAQVGLVISTGAVFTLSLFPFIPRLVRKFSSRKLAISFAFSQAVLLSVLATAPAPLFAVLCIALIFGSAPFISYQLDLMLECASTDENSAGRVRTLFITGASLAFMTAPLLVGLLIDGTEAYWRIFLAAALSLTPFIALLMFEKLPESEPPALQAMLATCSCLWKDKDLRAATLAGAVLQFFFHLAPLYVPLYLHTVLGFHWDDLGWVFAVMMLPFLFVEYPAGYIADRWLGDKELLITGIVIMGTSFAALGFVTSGTPLLVIAGILFTSRIGAALTEAMTEGHFFRRVSGRDATTISLFRMMRPLGALSAPLFASLLLLSGNFVLFFVVSGALLVSLGVIFTIPLRDVR